MKVLIVDDSKTMRNIVRRGVEAMGKVTITESSDGAEALTLFQSQEYDLILSDWNMPNMDGLEFLKAVREVNKEIPFLMITTEAERSRVITAIQAGVSDYLIKPFTADDLKAKAGKFVKLTC